MKLNYKNSNIILQLFFWIPVAIIAIWFVGWLMIQLMSFTYGWIFMVFILWVSGLLVLSGVRDHFRRKEVLENSGVGYRYRRVRESDNCPY
jgi:hypothetical protein